MLEAILFDLDGTLLPMDQDLFVKTYLGLLVEHLAPYGYDPGTTMKMLYSGIGAMVANDGSKNNETVFWDAFRTFFGPREETDRGIFEEFYATTFAKARVACGVQPEAAGLISMLKRRGIRCILATNPLFPATATMQRIRWAGLDASEFELVTTYENSSFCKPNPEYYREILDKTGLRPDQCLMVGNDAREDVAATKLGMRVFLLTDCLLHGEEGENHAPRGNFRELTALLERLTAPEAGETPVSIENASKND